MSSFRCRSGVNNVTCRFRPLTLVSSTQNVSSPRFNWALCTSPASYSNLTEGRYGLTLRASDNAGELARLLPRRPLLLLPWNWFATR